MVGVTYTHLLTTAHAGCLPLRCTQAYQTRANRPSLAKTVIVRDCPATCYVQAARYISWGSAKRVFRGFNSWGSEILFFRGPERPNNENILSSCLQRPDLLCQLSSASAFYLKTNLKADGVDGFPHCASLLCRVVVSPQVYISNPVNHASK